MSGFENNLQGLCKRLYARLGDPNETAWDKCQVRTAALDSLAMFGELRSDLFVEEVPIEVLPGLCVQTLPEECASVNSFRCIEINGTRVPVTEGNFSQIQNSAVHPPSRRGRGIGKSDPRFSSTTVANYRVAVNPNNKRNFAISPSISQGDSAFLIGECTSLSDFSENDCAEFPEDVAPFMIALTELSLYQLYSSDREAPEIAGLALASMQAFTNLTAISQGAVNRVLSQSTGNQ